MKLEQIVVGSVVLALGATVWLIVWLQPEEPMEQAVVEGLAGPVRATSPAPPAVAPAAAPAPATAPAPRAAESVSVYFDFDRAEVSDGEAAKLEGLLKREFKRIEAVGHADRIGAAAYNLQLSARRANAVKAYLTARDVPPEAVHATAKGELEPRSGDDCFDMGPELRRNRGLVECLQPDRRVEVSVADS